MARHASASRQNAFCGRHSGKVFGRSLNAHHYHFMAVGMPLLCIICKENDLAACSTRRSGQTLRDNFGLFQCILIEHGMKQFIKLLRFAAKKGGLFVNQPFTHKIHGNFYHSRSRALSVAGLQEPELPFLNGELHVLHIMVMLFQFVLYVVQLLVDFGHGFFHRRILACAFLFGDACTFCPTLRTDFCDLLWSTDAGYHVFALSVDKIFTVEKVFTVTGITAETYAGCRCVAHVSKYHGHNANGSAPLVGYSFHFSVKNGAFVHPAAEYGTNGSPQLYHGTIGEISTRLFLNGSLEELDKFLQRFD